MATILIIEDDAHGANITRRVLERAGHEVWHTTDGITGVKMLTQRPIDLVLLDMGLPDLDGHTIMALIKRVPDNPPVVAVTASTDPAVERRAMSYGCQAYITKPINTRTFADQIAPYIRPRSPTATPAPSEKSSTVF